MAYPVYPHIPIPVDGINLKYDFGVLVNRGWTNQESRLAPWPSFSLEMELNYKTLVDEPDFDESMAKLLGFYLERQGPFEEFLFYPWFVGQPGSLHLVTGQYLGVGDYVTTEFQIVRSISGYSEIIKYLDPTTLGDGWGAGGWGGAGWGGAPTGGSLTGKAPPYVYLQGVRQRQGYSVVSKNVVLPSGLSIDYLAVSFTTPPGHGVVISIDFNYFYRMRFKDAFKIKWKLKNLFEMDTITLSQV